MIQTFDNKRNMYRKARAISFEYQKEDGTRALKIQYYPYNQKWEEHEAIWDNDLKKWVTS